MTVRETFRVRYYECDMQQVVHNSVYLAWCDDLGDRMFVGAGLPKDIDWDVMVKTATITWAASGRLGDEIDVDATPTRWGRTSFDITYTGTCHGEEVFDSTITYVAIDTGSQRPIPVPEEFRRALTP